MAKMKVLVALDLGEGSDEALRQGNDWARNGALGIVHIVPDFVGTHTLLPHETELATLNAAEIERRVTELLARRVRDVTKRESAEIFVDTGGEHERIVLRAREWNADLIVVGSHGRHGLERIFGDVADKVVRFAHCSVLVARKSPEKGCILAAIDLSDAAAAALEVAAREAKRAGAPLVALHVTHAPANAYVTALGAALGAPPVVPTSDVLAQERAAIKETIETALAKIGANGEVVLVDGSPAVEIVRAAARRGATLIALGAHGTNAIRRLALGSVSESVTRAAPCSVLVARV